MINFRRTFIYIATPLVLGAVGFIGVNNANAQSNVESRQNNTEMVGRKQHRRPDFAGAASQLGVTEEALKTALGVPENPPENGERPPRPDFESAASQLGTTEEALKEALGVPKKMRGKRPDFAAAATQLGVTEEALKTALGVPENPPENGERPPRPDFEAAASQLGVTEEVLKEALGVGRGKRDGERPQETSQQILGDISEDIA